jgi:hypothetical protein
VVAQGFRAGTITILPGRLRSPPNEHNEQCQQLAPDAGAIDRHYGAEQLQLIRDTFAKVRRRRDLPMFVGGNKAKGSGTSYLARSYSLKRWDPQSQPRDLRDPDQHRRLPADGGAYRTTKVRLAHTGAEMMASGETSGWR